MVALRLKRQVEIDDKILNATLKTDTRFYTLDCETLNELFDRDSDIVVPAGVQCNILDEQRERNEVTGRRLLHCEESRRCDLGSGKPEKGGERRTWGEDDRSGKKRSGKLKQEEVKIKCPRITW